MKFFLKHWKGVYRVVLASLVVLNPMFVSDGHSWKYFEDSDAKISSQYKIHGIDISKYNKIIDWNLINTEIPEAEHIKFVFIKATEGIDLIDINYKKNWFDVSQTDIRKGAYHFFVPSKDPVLQAQNFINTVKIKKGDLRPVLDFETWGNASYSQNTILKNVKIWLDIIESHYGVKPIIYTNKPILSKLKDFPLGQYPIWISDFRADNVDDIANDDLQFWQYSDSGKLTGIDSPVDLNVFLGSTYKFEKLLIQ